MAQRPVVIYVASQELAKVSSLLPSNRKRSMMVHSLSSAMGLFSRDYSETKVIQVVTPARATYKDLFVYHSRDYLDFVLDPKISTLNEATDSPDTAEFGLEDDCPPFRGLPDYVKLVAGASLTAAQFLRDDRSNIAIAWDGGRHHARKSHASGFCYVADCILAILSLKRPVPVSLPQAKDRTMSNLRKPRVMYLDLDLHFSDAVSEAFTTLNSPSFPQVLTFSIHHAAPGFFPASHLSGLPSVTSPTFDPFTLSLPLRPGASDATYASIWPIVEEVRDIFKPDYIVVQCGLDGLSGDPCAINNWSLGGGQGSLGWCVNQILNVWEGKKLLLGGGGYNSANAARAWTYLTSIALGLPLSLDGEIPDHAAFPLYAPSFTLDVPAGNMQDQNSNDYLKQVKGCFEEVVYRMKERLTTHEQDEP